MSADWSAICGLKNYLQIKEICAAQSSIRRSKKNSIFRLNNYLQAKGLPADVRTNCRWKIICISKNYLQSKVFDLQIKELSTGLINMCRLKEVFHLEIKELSADWRIIYKSKFSLQMEEHFFDNKLFTEQITKNYLLIEEICVDRRSIPTADWTIMCRLMKCSICRLKNYPHQRTMYRSKFNLEIKEAFYLQIEELSADQRIFCTSKDYLQTEKIPTDWKIIWKLIEEVSDLQIQELSADQRTIYRSKKYLWFKESFHLQIEKVFHLKIEELPANWTIIYIIKELCPDQRSICRFKNYLYRKDRCAN